MFLHKLLRQTCWSYGLYLRNLITRNCQTLDKAMELNDVVQHLKKYAPLSLAESWDNVGLLVEPSTKNHLIKSILLTNDLTENVMEEAMKKNVNMIVSYHPPIFTPFKSLTRSSWKKRIILKAIENKIAIYSPHTSFDVVNGGINDWLASGLGKGTVKPLQVTYSDEKRGSHLINVLISNEDTSIAVEQLVDKIKEVTSVINADVGQNGNDVDININCHSNSLLDIMRILDDESSELLKRTNVFNLAKMPVSGTGIGRLCTLEEQVSVETIIERIKAHLKLKNVRLASGNAELSPQKSYVKTIALCAGAGGSVLKDVKADMYLTGEMSHHQVLHAVSEGIHVVLCEHTNTERGFFVDEFKDVLYNMLGSKVEVLVSSEDRDPIVIV